jgi:hypothetical protein
VSALQTRLFKTNIQNNDKQTNKQTNIQNNDKQTNKQTNKLTNQPGADVPHACGAGALSGMPVPPFDVLNLRSKFNPSLSHSHENPLPPPPS